MIPDRLAMVCWSKQCQIRWLMWKKSVLLRGQSSRWKHRDSTDQVGRVQARFPRAWSNREPCGLVEGGVYGCQFVHEGLLLLGDEKWSTNERKPCRSGPVDWVAQGRSKGDLIGRSGWDVGQHYRYLVAQFAGFSSANCLWRRSFNISLWYLRWSKPFSTFPNQNPLTMPSAARTTPFC